jgi:hypothetical protein
MREQVKLVSVVTTVIGASLVALLSLAGVLRSPWPEEGTDSWTQMGLAQNIETAPPAQTVVVKE